MNCHLCDKPTVPTGAGKYRNHNRKGTREKCQASGTVVPAEEPIPGAEEYTEELGEIAAEQTEAVREQVDSRISQFNQPARNPDLGEQPTLFNQPGSLRAPPVDVQPMTELGAEITARLKEMFHGFVHRQERSQQTTLGPSEIGSPCDRRLAMSLLRMPRVNPGGDGWASFVGTCVHVGLAEMFAWADAGSGRYAVESRLTYDNPHVPKGTADLIDRTLFMVDDHKLMGKWSRNKLKAKGPSPTYRVQGHTYGLFARARGERIEHIAIIGWPRDESSLDDLYVWTEPYNPGIALKALARVDDIAAAVLPTPEDADRRDVPASPYDLPMDSSDCKYCPFFMPGAKQSGGGVCNGKE
ncbi:hypothetical protein [Streptomyces microflavus]|uniref:hypothetical protein n=1 Tax=Streptomyces microflavus TaxID=1919 RepID=UPI0036D0242B